LRFYLLINVTIKSEHLCNAIPNSFLRLKLNDRLVDIASEGLLRPKLYDEKETFDFTTEKLLKIKI
jgi:hypothetical protein